MKCIFIIFTYGILQNFTEIKRRISFVFYYFNKNKIYFITYFLISRIHLLILYSIILAFILYVDNSYFNYVIKSILAAPPILFFLECDIVRNIIVFIFGNENPFNNLGNSSGHNNFNGGGPGPNGDPGPQSSNQMFGEDAWEKKKKHFRKLFSPDFSEVVIKAAEKYPDANVN
jgi:hypothetical protein